MSKKVWYPSIVMFMFGLSGCAAKIRTLELQFIMLEERVKNNEIAKDRYERIHNSEINALKNQIMIGDVWDYRGRLVRLEEFRKTIEEFKESHDKRWPPPVKLKGEKK